MSSVIYVGTTQSVEVYTSSTTTCRSGLLYTLPKIVLCILQVWYSYCTTARSADNIFHLWKRGSAASAAHRTALPRDPALQTPLREPRLPEPSCFQRITCTGEDKLWTETTLEAPSCFSIGKDLEGLLPEGEYLIRYMLRCWCLCCRDAQRSALRRGKGVSAGKLTVMEMMRTRTALCACLAAASCSSTAYAFAPAVQHVRCFRSCFVTSCYKRERTW